MSIAIPACDAGGDSGAPENGAPPLVTAEVELRVGSVEDPEHMLTRVGEVLSRDDGRFYVVQPQESTIRIHEPDGEPMGRIGAPGQGPGEFERLGAVGWWDGARDTLWAAELSAGRVSLFTAAGEFVRTISLTSDPYREVMTIRSILAVLPDGTALARPTFPARLISEGQVDAYALVRIPVEDDGAPRPVAETPIGNSQFSLQFGEGRAYSSQPFGDQPLLVFSGSAARVAVVERYAWDGSGEAHALVTVIDAAGGDTLSVRDLPYEPLPIPEVEVDSIVESSVETWTGFAEQMGMGRREVESQVRRELFVPENRPPIEGAFMSYDGSIWLRWADVRGTETHTWWRLDPEGEPAFALELPASISLRAWDGEHAWGVEADEFDVPYVVRLRIEHER